MLIRDSVIRIGDSSCDLTKLMEHKLSHPVKINKEKILTLCYKNFQ